MNQLTLAPTASSVSPDIERSLRPSLLHEYIGQSEVKETLAMFMEAARRRGECLDHVLIAGPPGLGKTTLSNIIAHEMKGEIHTLAGPNIEKKGDLATILTQIKSGDVLFIDEIHRMQRHVEEILYSAMEDYRLDLIIGNGSTARSVQIDLPRFTLVGATTRSGMLSNPLRDRFGVQFRMELYPVHELERIVARSAGILGLAIDTDACHEIARRARGTPRIANRLLKRVRDYAQVQADPAALDSIHVKKADAHAALELLKIDELGLEPLDRRYLQAIVEKFGGGPVGISTLSSVVGEDAETIEDVYEPFLLQQGLVQKTSRGRIATPVALSHLGRWEGAA